MKAIVFAETRGRRMGALTKNIPKSMLTVSGKPILEHIVESMREGGVKELIISVSFKKEVIMEYFGMGERFGVTIEYFEPKVIGGMARSLLEFQANVQNEDFIVTQADIIFDPDLIIGLSTLHAVSNRIATVAVSREFHIAPRHKAVCVDGQVITGIRSFVRKISKNVFRCIGVWAFSPPIFEALSSAQPPLGKEWTIMTALRDLLERGFQFNYYIYEGDWHAFHHPRDLLL